MGSLSKKSITERLIDWVGEMLGIKPKLVPVPVRVRSGRQTTTQR
jgi:hypothetical protein